MPKAKTANAEPRAAGMAEAGSGWANPQPAVAWIAGLEGGAFDEQIGWGSVPKVVRCDPVWKHAALARGVGALRAARAGRTSDTCIIFGNGPSLKWVNRSLLGRHPVFASNYAYLDADLFRHVTHYTVVNPLVAEQGADEINRLEGPTKFFPYWLAYCLTEEGGANFVNARGGPREFSTNAESWISWSATVSFFNLQLAYYLGFKRALLVGFDNAYVQPRQAVEGDPLMTEGEDPNHFDARYFQGKQWHAADTNSMEAALAAADEAGRADRRVIKNCTAGGSLELFERSTLEAELLRPSDTALYRQPNWREVRLVETVDGDAYAHVTLLVTDVRLAGKAWKRLALKVQRTGGGLLLEIRPGDCEPAAYPGFPSNAPADAWGAYLRLPFGDGDQNEQEFRRQTVAMDATGRDILAMIFANLYGWMAEAARSADKPGAILLEALRQEGPDLELIERRLFG